MSAERVREVVNAMLGNVLVPYAYDHTYDRALGEALGLLFSDPVRLTFGTSAVLLELGEEERHFIPWSRFEIAPPTLVELASAKSAGRGRLFLGRDDMQLATELELKAYGALLGLAGQLHQLR